MRRFRIALSLLFFLSFPAIAQDKTVPTDMVPGAEIITDKAGKRFVFMIDGQAVAVLDAEGLRVRESITYGGTISDTPMGSVTGHKNKDGEALDAD